MVRSIEKNYNTLTPKDDELERDAKTYASSKRDKCELSDIWVRDECIRLACIKALMARIMNMR
jgi:hypothetical protein